jgi:ubiquinone/menaquinone biosynthesis C-methylase UbiE
MKLNMGCGHNKMVGYFNVDLSPECQPDVVCDLEVLPWIWADNSVEVVRFNHSLEHLGQDSKVFLGMMKELYRICKNGAKIEINVPHPRHDNFLGDPTHVRVITPQLLCLFDRQLNDEWKRIRAANTPFAHYLGVDFVITNAETILAEPYSELFQSGKISVSEIETMERERNNIASEYRIEMVARK